MPSQVHSLTYVQLRHSTPAKALMKAESSPQLVVQLEDRLTPLSEGSVMIRLHLLTILRRGCAMFAAASLARCSLCPDGSSSCCGIFSFLPSSESPLEASLASSAKRWFCLLRPRLWDGYSFQPQNWAMRQCPSTSFCLGLLSLVDLKHVTFLLLPRYTASACKHVQPFVSFVSYTSSIRLSQTHSFHACLIIRIRPTYCTPPTPPSL
mmetsp:Transcript_14674/g.44807  ORF Transcript_14674/g.44807 Transcript_14674/m.44807 type:complete len:208 (-) Transcript_14674:440-1063(-)